MSFVGSDRRLSHSSDRLADAMKLIDERTPDGSRHFARLPRIAPWKVVRDHVLSLGSARVVNDVGEGPAEPWLDFTFRGHRFLIHCHENQFRLTVRDPQCSDLLLFQVGLHFQRLLNELGEEGMGDEKPGGCAVLTRRPGRCSNPRVRHFRPPLRTLSYRQPRSAVSRRLDRTPADAHDVEAVVSDTPAPTVCGSCGSSPTEPWK